MSDTHPTPTTPGRFQRITNTMMAACLAVMAVSVFVNVVLRYGFGSGVAASEELSRLLFVWMVFIGATAAYPAGEHMAFTSLVGMLKNKPLPMRLMTALIRMADAGATIGTWFALACELLSDWRNPTGAGTAQLFVEHMPSYAEVFHSHGAAAPKPSAR